MKIDIIQILDRGVANKERLWLKVLANTNLQYFIVFDTIYTSKESISNSQSHALWLSDKEVKAGDTLVLYTSAGSPSEQRNKDGSTTHFLYWGLQKTIWNAKQSCAVLFEINTWQTSKYES